MQFSELQNQTAYYLDDLNFGYFTLTQVKIWLNNAQKELQKRLLKAGENYYLSCVQTTLVGNQSDYVLPDDFRKLHRLEIVMGGTVPNETVNPIIPITTNQKDLVQWGVGTPQFYSIKRNRLVLYPAPDSPLTLRLYYSYMVTDMVLDTDEPDAPEAYHALLPLLAAEDGFIKDGRVSALLEKKLKEFEADLDADADDRTQDTPRTIIETGQGVGGSFFW